MAPCPWAPGLKQDQADRPRRLHCGQHVQNPSVGKCPVRRPRAGWRDPGMGRLHRGQALRPAASGRTRTPPASSGCSGTLPHTRDNDIPVDGRASMEQTQNPQGLIRYSLRACRKHRSPHPPDRGAGIPRARTGVAGRVPGRPVDGEAVRIRRLPCHLRACSCRRLQCAARRAREWTPVAYRQVQERRTRSGAARVIPAQMLVAGGGQPTL